MWDDMQNLGFWNVFLNFSKNYPRICSKLSSNPNQLIESDDIPHVIKSSG